MRLAVMGRVRARIYQAGQLVGTWEGANVITDVGRAALAAALVGDIGAAFAEIGAGEGGAAADASDTGLQLATLWRAVEEVSDLGGGTVRIRWRIPEGAATGANLIELGLRASDNTLIARRVRSEAIPMAADVALEGDWDISLVEA